MGKRAAANLLAAPSAREPFAPVPTFWSDQYDVTIKSRWRPWLVAATCPDAKLTPGFDQPPVGRHDVYAWAASQLPPLSPDE